MFRLIRLPIFCGAAFVAGMIYERANIREACQMVEGVSINGLCMVPEVLND